MCICNIYIYIFIVVVLQELIAYGSTHIVGSFFLCFPNAAAMSRSAVQDGAGGKTQVHYNKHTMRSFKSLLLVL